MILLGMRVVPLAGETLGFGELGEDHVARIARYQTPSLQANCG